MTLEIIDVDVNGETREALLNVPEGEDRATGVVVIPGAGHGPHGDIFDVAAYELAVEGSHVVRMETWESREELEAKTLGEIHAEVDAMVDGLRARGCSTVSVLAKSFGGGVALTRVPEAVERFVLWEPVVEVGVDPAESTDPADRIGDGEGIAVGIDTLDHVDVPVRILCGDAERGVPIEECRAIVDAVADGDLTVIPDATHWFNTNRTAIVEATLDYLVPEP